MWNFIKVGNRNSVVDIATVLRAGRSGVPVPLGTRDFSVFQNVQTGSGASYSKGNGILLRAYSSKIKNEWDSTSTTPICFQGMGRENLLLLCFNFIEKIQTMDREYYVRRRVRIRFSNNFLTNFR